MAGKRAQCRLAATLATDVIGCSRLMERDEVGTFAALKERRKKVLEPLTAAYRNQRSHAIKEARRIVGAESPKIILKKSREEQTVTNVELIRTQHEIWNTGSLKLIESVYASDFTGYWPASSAVPVRRGVEAVRVGVQRTRTAFPDWHKQVLDVFGVGEKVASRYISTGTHSGPYWGLEPTGKRIEIQEISIYRCAGGRIVEQWCIMDELARLQQLGVDEAYLRRMLKL